MMEKLKWVSDRRHHHGANHHQSLEKDRAYGYSWPQRNYRCSFCKKEFKSAQALGGHMNVHRRDRARMRQLSPPQTASWDSTNVINPSSTLVNPINNNPSFSKMSAASSTNHEFLQLPYYKSMSSSVTAAAITNDYWQSSAKKTTSKLCGGDVEKLKNKGTMLEFTTTMAAAGLTAAARKKDARVNWKANDHQFVRLDLSLGNFFQDSSKEDLDLDLELRLGCS